MKPRIITEITALFASIALLLSLSLVPTPAKSAEQPRLLYATAELGTKLVTFSLEAKRVRVIGDTGFPFSLALAPCPPGGVRYTITNTFDPNKAQLATLNLGTGAATLVGSPLGQVEHHGHDLLPGRNSVRHWPVQLHGPCFQQPVYGESRDWPRYAHRVHRCPGPFRPFGIFGISHGPGLCARWESVWSQQRKHIG